MYTCGKWLPFSTASFRCAIAGLFVGLALTSGVASAKPIPVEDLFKNADVSAAELSPDGKSVAMSVSVDGKRSLAVMDIDSGKITQVAAYADAQIGEFSWINNERLVYSLSYLFDEHAWTGNIDDGLFAVNRDGSQSKELLSTIQKQIENGGVYIRSMQMVAPFDAAPDEILVREANGKNQQGRHAYRLNTVTGKKREIDIAVIDEVNYFWVDHTTTIRLALTSSNELGKQNLWYREGEDSPWRIISKLDTMKPSFTPLAFDSDNKTLFVASQNGGDKNAIYKYDFEKDAIGELVYANPDADLRSGLVFSRDTNKFFGIRYWGDMPGIHWIDEDRQRVQDSIDAALPGRINRVTGDEKSRGLLVYSWSDANIGTYYYYNRESHKLKKLFSAKPWIHPEDLSEMSVFHYAARDGLDIPAYLTLPKGKPVKRLPLIVLPHGGPWARDYWGYNAEVQFLASRGYAVLQPEFRSSTGFGFNLFKKGWAQWGESMQDDITDGVQNLVKQGVVDGAKVCIMGGSYGGYAVAMGMAKDPALYRCGIDMFGVTDIKLHEKISDFNEPGMDEFRRYGAKALIGDVAKDPEHFDAVSPLKQSSKIKAPMLMVYGAKDNRVPVQEGEQLRDALLKQGNVVEWMVLEGEGHGIQNKESNRYQFYHALDAFLKKYNPAD